tara:strand:- start:22150 stop:23706 length:1557 start_codon:yes stop_codon:yes gene_type:complete
MKTALVLALTGLVSTAVAQQIPIPAHASVYNGFSRGFNFTAQVDFLITQLDLPTDAFQAGDTAGYGVRVNGAVVYQSAGNVGAVAPGITIMTGDVVDIVGNWSPATTGNFTAHNSYGNTAPFASSIIGVAHTLNRTGLQWDVSDPGGATAAWLAPGAGAIGRVLVDCAPLGGGTVAQINSNGTGCVNSYASAYEMTNSMNFGLNNTMVGIDFINTGSGYVITPSAGAINPIGGLDPAAVAIPGVGDDAVIPVGTLGLEIGSNGWLATGTGNSNLWAPDPTLALNQAAAQFSCWSDLEPNAGGQIVYEELGTIARVTYDAVLSWGTTDTQTFQFEIDTATGNASLYFGSITSATAHAMFIGYSPAGPNLDPGSISIETELAANGAIVTAGTDTAPLALAGVGRPVMGAAAVNYDATTSNIESGAIFHVGIVGLTDPALPLNLIGFPAGCTLYASADLLVGPAVVAGGTGSETWTVIGLPVANPIFNGFELYAQSATLDLSLVSSTARASNGIKLTLGDL